MFDTHFSLPTDVHNLGDQIPQRYPTQDADFNPPDEETEAEAAATGEDQTLRHTPASSSAAAPPLVDSIETTLEPFPLSQQRGDFSGPYTYEVYERARAFGISAREFATLQVGDVKCVYHPHSGKPYKIIPVADHQSVNPSLERERIKKTHPHRGFHTRDDFELAEFVLDAALNTKLVRRLFTIFNKALDGKSAVTMRSAAELDDAWKVAATSEVPVGVRSSRRVRVSAQGLHS